MRPLGASYGPWGPYAALEDLIKFLRALTNCPPSPVAPPTPPHKILKAAFVVSFHDAQQARTSDLHQDAVAQRDS